MNKKNDASGVAFVRYLPILQSESNSQDYTNVDHSIVTYRLYSHHCIVLPKIKYWELSAGLRIMD